MFQQLFVCEPIIFLSPQQTMEVAALARSGLTRNAEVNDRSDGRRQAQNMLGKAAHAGGASALQQKKVRGCAMLCADVVVRCSAPRGRRIGAAAKARRV